MRVIIDLIEDIRDNIGDGEGYRLYLMLLKDNLNDTEGLISVGETKVNSFDMNIDTKRLLFSLDISKDAISIEELVQQLLILSMREMMYEVTVNVNQDYNSVEIIGFGVSKEEKKYFLFIKL